MHYSPANYEQHIVCKHGVELQGFTWASICNPSDIGSVQHLNQLVKALENKSCQWVVLPNEKWEARKEALSASQPLPRKRRKANSNDEQMSRKRRKVKSAGFIEDSSDYESTGGKSGEVNDENVYVVEN